MGTRGTVYAGRPPLAARWLAGWLTLWLAWASVAHAAPPEAPTLTVAGWLQRLHAATRNRAYSGTFVVTRGDEVAAARVAHVCDGQHQIERIETLSGPVRVTWRYDDEVLTLWPQRQFGLRDRREVLRLFPGPSRVPGVDVDEYYRAVTRGAQRVAGLDAWVVEFVPRDEWRYGYRVWSEQTTGLALKLQTVGPGGQVLEQMAYTDVQLDVPLRMDALLRQMADTQGYRVQQPNLTKTTLQALGWRFNGGVPGFQWLGCWQRDDAVARERPPVQCVLTDGLASVSLFIGTGGAAPARVSGAMQVRSLAVGEHTLTAVGEVPPATLQRLLAALEREP
ncbi:MucB/RseB C-terminal domain-containing protein [Tepidimonas aquatica]|uniref:Sigma factor AlgU regulatory protein MucB n=1 Tax=Tepidimonas aquatica TaxID=247482 RepID=A0A554WLH7_9BURK|nr:MucB/RseB C-terminal domain-containing protein [Tepidimonas aquatica]TSE24406.1 Sigma factor AlgU regulatory protein MucB [Tepidimonas aquatica]